MNVVKKGVYYFDNKPLLVKPWNPEMEINTESVSSLPIWVRFLDLDIKYWGLTSLGKLGSIMGIPIKTDRFTMEKTKLQFARLLIDIKLTDPFPEYIEFVNDHDVVVRVQVEYEWKPIKCQHCKMFGHIDVDCKKKANVRQEWRRKEVQTGQNKEAAETSSRQAPNATSESMPYTGNEGFTLVQRPATRGIHKDTTAVVLKNANPFASLQDIQEGQGSIQQIDSDPPYGQNMQLEH